MFVSSKEKMTKKLDQLSLSSERKFKVHIVLLTNRNGNLTHVFFMLIDTFNYAASLCRDWWVCGFSLTRPQSHGGLLSNFIIMKY